MDEDKIRENNENQENEVIKTGLELSDTEAYNVSAGIVDESFEEKEPEKNDSGKANGKGVAAFTAGFIACLAVLFVLCYVFGLGKFLPEKQFQYYKNLSDKYGKYEEIMKLIEEDPIATYNATEIDDAKLKEIVSSIGDPYAEYYTAEEYKEFQKMYLGDYVGIGIAVVEEDGKVVIKSILRDGPAEDADLKEEDVIKAVDGKEPADVDEAIDMISGEVGTKVVLTIERGGETFDVSLNRAHIEEDSVYYTEYEDEEKGLSDTNIGYIAITAFREETCSDLKLAVRDLEGEGCDRFIIDLRNNGGGLTNSSIDIADYLLPECRIMTEKSTGGNEKVFNSEPSSAGIDYVVLVNENTASASEILSAAIQDNKGATIIGKKTYGKGVTQLFHRFDDGTGIKITTTEYFRPNGGKVNGVGITPDIEAEDGDDIVEKALEELEK